MFHTSAIPIDAYKSHLESTAHVPRCLGRMSSTESTEPKTNNPETPAGGVVDQHGHVKIQILLRSSEPNCSCFQPPFISWSTNSEFAVLQCPNSINCPNIFSRHWFWQSKLSEFFFTETVAWFPTKTEPSFSLHPRDFFRGNIESQTLL